MKPPCFAPLAVLLGLGCAARQEFSVLIHMIPAQEKFFREKEIPAFEKKFKCKMRVETFEDFSGIDQAMEKYPGRLLLVKTPFEQTLRLSRLGKMMSVDEAVGDPAEGQKIREKYFLLQLATVDGKLHYFPRKFETRLMVYLKSRVKEAVFNWGAFQETIDSILKPYNGRGLPDDFVLEENPSEWDHFDLFVAGYYWAYATPGAFTPKIATRGRRYSGTVQTMVDRVYQLGGGQQNVLSMEGESVVDMFEWEALYAREGIYNPKTWTDSLTGGDIWKLFQKGECYLSFMTQVDCFFLHGTFTDDLPGILSDPEDLGYSLMPRGVSLALDTAGRSVREGARSVSTGGWWWGIPKDSPSPKMSVALADFILSTENQMEGCSRFGMIPVRKDLLGDIGLLFGRGWISDMFDVSLQQLVQNRFTTVPLTTTYKDLEQIYLDAWYDMVAGGDCGPGGRPSREYIERKLASTYASRAKALNASPPK